MTISGALSNALSGLVATRRNAEVVSSNIANSMTEGYSRRSLEVEARSTGNSGGVRVLGISRAIDPAVLAERRLTDSRAGFNDAIATATATLERVLGRPDEVGSLSSRVTAFESALVSSASLPHSDARQQDVVDDAKRLVTTISDKSSAVQDSRESADREIGLAVEQLNRSLDQVRRLNSRIVSAQARRADTAGMQDERQKVIDSISELVPLKVVPRERGSVALMTTNGAVLLDATAAQIGFTTTPVITAHQRVEDGNLGKITLRGRELEMSGSGNNPLAGGKLQALFDIRDKIAPEAQSRLDGFARDLVERFQDSNLDTTLVAGAPGLFTDAGAALDPSDIAGLSTRLALNTAVDPEEGGALWRIRDGLGATAPGPSSDSRLLTALSTTLSAKRPATDPSLGGVSRSMQGHAAFMETTIGTRAERARSEQTITAAEHHELKMMEARSGVDTDQEMQTLLMIEQAYAANAKVIQAAQEMLDTLMRI